MPLTSAQPLTKGLFLLAAAVMNSLALACLDDPAVPRDVAEKLNDDQQWLAGCDWPILGWDTSDPPPGMLDGPDYRDLAQALGELADAANRLRLNDGTFPDEV